MNTRVHEFGNQSKTILETIPEDKNVTLFIGPEQISNGSTPLEDITTALDVDEDLKARVIKYLEIFFLINSIFSSEMRV